MPRPEEPGPGLWLYSTGDAVLAFLRKLEAILPADYPPNCHGPDF